MRKLLLITTALVLAVAFAFPGHVQAKRLLPQAKPVSSGSTKTVVSSTRGVSTGVKFKGDRLGIVVTFVNPSIASSINYQLTYDVRGTTQGAGGALSPDSDNNSVRELIFGTCSHGVCRYDSGITNARFTVTTILQNGLRIVKRYRLRV